MSISSYRKNDALYDFVLDLLRKQQAGVAEVTLQTQARTIERFFRLGGRSDSADDVQDFSQSLPFATRSHFGRGWAVYASAVGELAPPPRMHLRGLPIPAWLSVAALGTNIPPSVLCRARWRDVVLAGTSVLRGRKAEWVWARPDHRYMLCLEQNGAAPVEYLRPRTREEETHLVKLAQWTLGETNETDETTGPLKLPCLIENCRGQHADSPLIPVRSGSRMPLSRALLKPQPGDTAGVK